MDAEDYVECTWAAFRVFIPAAAEVFVWIGTFVFASALFAYYFAYFDLGDAFGLVAAAGLTTCIVWHLMRLLLPVILRLHFRYAASSLRETDVEVTSEGVTVNCEVFSLRYRWSSVKEIVDAKKGLLFLDPLGNRLLWLAHRAFPSWGVRSEVIWTAERSGVQVRRIWRR